MNPPRLLVALLGLAAVTLLLTWLNGGDTHHGSTTAGLEARLAELAPADAERPRVLAELAGLIANEDLDRARALVADAEEQLAARPDPVARAHVLLARGRLHHLSSDRDSAVRDYTAAFDLAERVGDRSLRARTRMGVLAGVLWSSDQKQAAELLRDLEAHYLDDLSPRYQSTFFNLRAVHHQMQLDYREARQDYVAALEIVEQLPGRPGLAVLYYNLATTEMAVEETTLARASLQRALAVAPTKAPTRMVAMTHNSLGAIELGEGHFALAREHFARGMAVGELLGSGSLVSYSQRCTGEAFLQEELWSEARDSFRASLAADELLDQERAMAWCGVARAALELGDDAEALDAAQRSAALHDGDLPLDLAPVLHAVLAEAHGRAGEFEQAYHHGVLASEHHERELETLAQLQEQLQDEWRQTKEALYEGKRRLWMGLTASAVVIALLLAFMARQRRIRNRDLEQRNVVLRVAREDGLLQQGQLEQQLVRAKVPRGPIPWCSTCKSVRNGEGAWQAVEEYLHQHGDLRFSHTFCPGCWAEAQRRRDEVVESS